MHRNSPPRRGLTLIEVAVSLILVSTVLLVSITASANLMRSSNQTNTAIVAHELAGILLDEISSQPFVDQDSNSIFGVEPDEDAENRLTFDDVDDYNNFRQSPPSFRNGQFISGFDHWTLTVTVQPALPNSTGFTTTDNASDPLRLVTVTCTSPILSPTGQSPARKQSILVSRTPENLTAGESYESMRQLELSFSPNRNMTIVAPLRNHPAQVTNE